MEKTKTKQELIDEAIKKFPDELRDYQSLTNKEILKLLKRPPNPLVYPSHVANTHSDPRNQISGGGERMRDKVAIFAMQALLSNGTLNVNGQQIHPGRPEDAETLSKVSYIMADAMLKVRTR